MMNYEIFVWEMINFIIVSLFSTIIYINFDYQDNNKFYKLFIPKNDSIWERLKVLIAPTIITMVIELLVVNITPNFVFAKFVSLTVMSIANPLVFILLFSYSKWDVLISNVLSIVASALIGLIFSILILSLPGLSSFITYISILGILLIIAFYFVATYYQTDDFIFVDPVTKRKTLKKDN